MHLNTLCSEDEFWDHSWDVGLVIDGVGNTLEQRLHWGHTLENQTSAQETVVEHHGHQSRTNLEHRHKNVIIYETVCQNQKSARAQNTAFTDVYQRLPLVGGSKHYRQS